MILVTGATGNVGGALLRLLLDQGRPVRALTRDAARAHLPAGADVAEGDLDDAASLTTALAGVEAIFLYRSGNESAVLKAATAAGVERVVLLSTIAARSRPESFVGRIHLDAEEAVASAGLTWTFLRPVGFASNTAGWAPMVRAGRVLTAYPSIALPIIHPGDIAAVAAAALTGPGHEKAVHTLSGPAAVSPADQVAALSRVLGREVECAGLSRAEAAELLGRQMPAEVVEATLDFAGHPTPEELWVRPTVRAVTGRPARTYEDWAREHAHLFR